MSPEDFEFICDLLGNVLISGGTLLFIDWISDVIADYSGTKKHPGMEPMPKPYELGCKCPSCHDGFTSKTRADFEMDHSDWQDMVLGKEDSKYDPKTGELRKNKKQ